MFLLWRTYSASAPRLPTSESQTPEQQEPQPPPPPSSSSDATPSHPSSPPLIYPSAPASHHTSLPTFLAHAARTNLDPSSTVYVGTHFEYTALHALSRYGLALRRVGGVADCGIDLLGTWALPSASTSSSSSSRVLRVLVQCKAVQRAGPHLVRELEGAFAGAPAGWRGGGVLGLLVGEKPATKGMREAVGRSRWPMGFVACSREGRVEQFLWNQRAEEEGLEGMGVGMKYVVGEKELVLTWKGRNLPFVERGVEEC